MAKLRLLKTGHGDLLWLSGTRSTRNGRHGGSGVRRALHGGASGLSSRRTGSFDANSAIRKIGAGNPDRPGDPRRLMPYYLVRGHARFQPRPLPKG